jgi:hypothetical protein
MSRFTRYLLAVAALGSFVSACKSRQDTAEVLGSVKRSDDRPPAVLYHFGEFGHLEGYGKRTGTFNSTEWSQIGSVGEAQRPYRRGLYVSQHPAYNERYALDKLKAEQSRAPWMLAVQLKAECHNEGRFEGNIQKALYGESTRFSGFLNRSAEQDLNSVDKFKALCPADFFVSQQKEQSYLASPQWRPRFERCVAVVEKYFTEENIGVVYDAWWVNQGFWYIRDPNCIERLDGSAEGNLTAFADIPDLWQQRPYTDNTPRQALPSDQWGSGEAMLNMLLRAYTLVPGADNNLLARIESNVVGDVYLNQFAKAAASQARLCANRSRYSVFTDKVGGFLYRIGSNSQAFRDQLMKFVNDDLVKLGANCEMPVVRPAETVRAPTYTPPATNSYTSNSNCPDDHPRYVGRGRSLTECRNLARENGDFCGDAWRSVSTRDYGDCCCGGVGGSSVSSGSGSSSSGSTSGSSGRSGRSGRSNRRQSSSNGCPSDRPIYVGTADSTKECFRLAADLGYSCPAVRLLGDGGKCCCSQ